jgi:hypothetical protein
MQGWHFLILDEDGRPYNHGRILEKITPHKYLCRFNREPVASRVCDLSEIQKWNLFPSKKEMDAFILEILKPVTPLLPPEQKLKKVMKKKTAKKTKTRVSKSKRSKSNAKS